jgi:hypothetical protein
VTWLTVTELVLGGLGNASEFALIFFADRSWFSHKVVVHCEGSFVHFSP